MKNHQLKDFEDLPSTILVRYGIIIIIGWIFLIYFGLSQIKFPVRMDADRIQAIGTSIKVNASRRDAYLVEGQDRNLVLGISNMTAIPKHFKIERKTYMDDCDCYEMVLNSDGEITETSGSLSIKYLELPGVQATELLKAELFFHQ